jgi:hypothetical protein
MIKTINCQKREKLKADEAVTDCYKSENDMEV